jgi:hypothetical protein
MKKLFKEIIYDAEFIKDHQLQPGWYKVLKVFLLLGFGVGYFLLFGTRKALVFFAIFFGLSLVVHLVYRVKTNKFTESWLDFVVEEVDGVEIPTRIGKYYYLAVITNGLIALLVSQLLIGHN